MDRLGLLKKQLGAARRGSRVRRAAHACSKMRRMGNDEATPSSGAALFWLALSVFVVCAGR